MSQLLEKDVKTQKISPIESPDRFKTAASTHAIDRFMTHFIKVGGVSLIVAVFAIFLFIFIQILPLFQGAKVTEAGALKLPQGKFVGIGVDEWSEYPFAMDEKGRLYFMRVDGQARVEAPVMTKGAEEVTSFHYKPFNQRVMYGKSNGGFYWADLNFEAEFEAGKRKVVHNLKVSTPYTFEGAGGAIKTIDFGDAGEMKLAAAIRANGNDWKLSALLLTQEQDLFGSGETAVRKSYDLTPFMTSRPIDLRVNGTADGILVRAEGGDVYYFHRTGDEIELRQKFQPFSDLKDQGVSLMEFLFGDMSLVLVSASGENRIFSLFVPDGQDTRVFGRTKEFKPLKKSPDFYATSLRNKAFMLGDGRHVSLRYGTTADIRWEKTFETEITTGVLSGKYDRLLLLDRKNELHVYKLHDPHPEAGFQAFFGKMWYEGSSQPKYEWQSTGGSDDFEPKLSLIPLIVGTLKGTFYAMIFALPIAVLAALYTSQFLNPKIRAIAKPTMEIMASLPSVVLGFLAALWLAPLIEDKVPAILLMFLLIPTAACVMGVLFQYLPIQSRQWVRGGFEFAVLFPVLLGVVWLSLQMGPVLEKLVFGGDFRSWWPQVTGATFDQRNSLAVGFMMGFAVIPIIFTITEDSLTNVPSYLRSGSLALGASRWQTALYVVLPTASAGIFSAFMVGLGRAIGETMIVVMATGNTPVMDFNMFSGMRTLSANIAVELPEAPHHGTLYRTLFLGAMVLFLATFLVNTIAEVLRQRIREKYKTV